MSKKENKQFVSVAEASARFNVSRVTITRWRESGCPSIKQEWGTCSDIAKIYGKNRSTITRFIGPMAAEGKIRTCTTKDGATGAYGASMYNLADVQRCFMENAREAARQAG